MLKEEDEDEVATKLQAAFKAMQVYTMVFDKRRYPVYKELYLPRKSCLNKSCKVREELAQKDRDSGTEISGNT